MNKRAGAALAVFFCVAMSGFGAVRAGELAVSPDDFGIDPNLPLPMPPPFMTGAPAEQTYAAPPPAYPAPGYPAATPYQAAIAPVPQMPPAAPFATGMPYPTMPATPATPPPGPLVGAAEPTGIFLPGDPLSAAPAYGPVYAPAYAYAPVPAPAPGAEGTAPVTDPLQAAAPDLYASLTANITAASGDPSIPVVVRPATTSQATDLSGIPVDLSAIAAQNNPLVDWNAARAGTPYPVATPGQPGFTTYVVPIQVPVYVQGGAAAEGAGAGQPAAQPFPPAATQPAQPPVQLTAAPLQPVQPGNPFAGVIAVTPGRQPVVPTATAAIAGHGGVFYYGPNPVSIASAIGMNAADGTEYFDFAATPDGAINLVTAAQIKQALQRRVPLVILDVRGDLVREIEGHIQGDVGVPFEPRQTFAARVAQAIPTREVPVVVYCEDGIWSSQAADALLGMGYKTFLMGSYLLWR